MSRRRPIRWLPVLLALLLLCGCGKQETPVTQAAPVTWDALEFDGSMALSYAEQFSVDYDQGGYQKITIGGTEVYLVVPEGAEVPANVPQEVTVLRQPLDSIYLVATSAMDLIRELDAMDTVRLSGTDASGWYLEEAKQAIEDGRILYAGKYSAPDYERIVSEGCDLALESTMIYHTPEVKEQLERFGIPVLVERSSYESHPLGRMEWIKLYGALLGKEEAAASFFDRQLELLTPVLEQENTGKTVAFFYITSNGAVNVRKSGDYIAKCIDLAGGVYLPQGLTEENALSTMTIQMETFYQQAREADVLIYNSTIDGELQTLDQLLEKSSLMKDFKAVQTGNVWCTGKNLFQESLGLGDLILDIHAIVNAEDPDSLTYLHKLT
ncbi:MAG: ABC transporter substrate-binding protein [Candidatus Limivicinus sp.]